MVDLEYGWWKIHTTLKNVRLGGIPIEGKVSKSKESKL